MLKIVIVTIILSIIILYFKSINSELTTLVLLASGIVIAYFVIDYLDDLFLLFDKLQASCNIDKTLYKIILKVTVIGYLVEFGSSFVEDMGLNSLAVKLVFVGKVIILITSLPIFYSIINVFIGALN